MAMAFLINKVRSKCVRIPVRAVTIKSVAKASPFCTNFEELFEPSKRFSHFFSRPSTDAKNKGK